MRKRFHVFNNRFRTTKNTEAAVFENGGFVGNLGLSKMTATDYTHFIWLFKSLLSFCL